MKLFGFGRRNVRQDAVTRSTSASATQTRGKENGAENAPKSNVDDASQSGFDGTRDAGHDTPLGDRGPGTGTQGTLNLRMQHMTGDVEVHKGPADGPPWSDLEKRSLEMLDKKYPRGPSKPGAYLRQDGTTHQYIHRVGEVDDSVLQSIQKNGLRAAEATGTFGHAEGVYALNFDGGGQLLDPKLYGEAVYVLFESRHPCVVGDHLNKETAVFLLDEGKHIGTENMIFVKGNKDGTYTRIDPNDSTKTLPLDLGADGKTFTPTAG